MGCLYLYYYSNQNIFAIIEQRLIAHQGVTIVNLILKKPSGLKPKFNINLTNEKSLHSAIKHWFSQPGDLIETEVNTFIIDIVRGNTLIEIQTGNFNALKRKLTKLLPHYKVKLVYPIIRQKWILTLTDDGSTILSRRKSPKTGTFVEVFSELLHISQFVQSPNFTIELLLVDVEELQLANGKGSWRRKGKSILDRKLLAVVANKAINHSIELLDFLPDNLPTQFTNKILAQHSRYSIYVCRKITYCLKKIGLIKQIGKSGRELLYEIAPSPAK